MKNFIPKAKDDHEATEVLRTMAWEDIYPYAGELLTWLQDMNWPVGIEARDILLPHVDSIQEHIIEILRGNDGMWKYWILYSLIDYADETHIGPDLLQEIKRIAGDPTEGDKREEIDEAAKEILERFSA
ncbi:DUF5071 domain-containing protein [Chitinophaga barathri]|uniref:DUF5071 domain-containing protein n=1 Tax=Chitinophaga barathri TaxID=1647451 RepID=A0A3N4MDT2_9BACT|nr:DUF5071 domain-containing protein [Chitinophaga barathri]RPD40136.1 DUF5071 domain-containing protein [Chitinophaga barathri]